LASPTLQLWIILVDDSFQDILRTEEFRKAGVVPLGRGSFPISRRGSAEHSGAGPDPYQREFRKSEQNSSVHYIRWRGAPRKCVFALEPYGPIGQDSRQLRRCSAQKLRSLGEENQRGERRRTSENIP